MAAIYSNGISFPTGLHFGANFILASIGDKQGVDPIWVIQYSGDPTAEMIARTGNVGMMVQLGLMVIAVILMERHIRKQSPKRNQTD